MTDHQGSHVAVVEAAAESQSARHITPDLWTEFFPDIYNLYMHSSMKLADIRAHMRKEHLFDPSLKHWKKQLSAWDLKRHLNVRDAAHILKLYNSAQFQGIHRKVCWHNREKTYLNIVTYIKKSKTIDTEAELLSQIRPQDQQPWYITFKDAGSAHSPETTDNPSHNLTSGLRPTFSAGTFAMDPFTQGDQMQSLAAPLAASDGSPWSFLSASGAPDNFASSSVDAPSDDAEDSIDEHDFSLDADEGTTVQSTAIENAMRKLNSDNFLSVTQPLVIPVPGSAGHGAPGILNGLMSQTPIEINRLPNRYPVLIWDSMSDASRAVHGNDTECDELNSGTNAASFLTHCIQFCINLGQGFDIDADQKLSTAVQHYRNVLEHEFQDCLTVLTNLVALFESYGQKPTTTIILRRIRQILQSIYSDIHPLTETVHFMIETQLSEKGRDDYDIENLRLIHHKLNSGFGTKSRLALTAGFNVTWALAEMKRYPDALSMLVHLKPACENAFGRFHLQTISCAALLARVHLKLGETGPAIALIEETVLGRIEKTFASTHPFFWEAKNRQAAFLVNLSAHYQNYEEQQTYLRQAECILREVLSWRFTVLGSANPRTQCTFKILKTLLKKQGRDNDAAELWHCCEINSQPELLFESRSTTTGV